MFRFYQLPITVAARSKAWTVFARSNTGIVGSNLTRGMDVCVRVFCVFVVLCVGSGLATGWSPVKGVLPTVYRLRNWKSGQGPQRPSHRYLYFSNWENYSACLPLLSLRHYIDLIVHLIRNVTFCEVVKRDCKTFHRMEISHKIWIITAEQLHKLIFSILLAISENLYAYQSAKKEL
jgi:hypothetical protein